MEQPEVLRFRAMEKQMGIYFPEGLVDEESGLDKTHAIWCAHHLASMEEPSLWDDASDATLQIRFLWLRSFHAPVVVRISESPRGAVLILKTTLGQAGYGGGVFDKGETRPLSGLELARIKDEFTALDFFERSSGTESGLDGACWMLEAVCGGEHHGVTQWSPTSGDLREFCLLLLSMAGFEPIRIY